jgi:UDP-N-acetylglucosamine--N-acetylmuramyl-(pentapeptide) pyrophosphoryl-undecaprenol N-acetylglucosamine transferase
MVPGITHRMLKFLARRVYVTFPASSFWFPAAKVRMFGNPLRREFLTLDQKKKDGVFTVLILGGSQGAHALNRAMVEALSEPDQKPVRDIKWIHQTGTADEIWVQEAYQAQQVRSEVQAFFTDMATVYQQADLVVCRAGATTISELTAMGKPAIFIPFPFAADDHQTQNARELRDRGAAEILMEHELTGPMLMTRILHYWTRPEELAAMGRQAANLGRPHAARDIADDWNQLFRPRAT